MSTLAEIEQAIEQLPENDVSALRVWLSAREAQPVLTKWRAPGTGLVKEMGGVDAYLQQVRGESAEK